MQLPTTFSDKEGSPMQILYEPTLGYIAAEVAIAMNHPYYRSLETNDERIAFVIGYHANRSRPGDPSLYDPVNFSDSTYTEIQWVNDFQDLIEDVENEMTGE